MASFRKWSLERLSPALYGWLVWGGGAAAIVALAKFLAIIVVIAGAFIMGTMVR